LFPTYDRYLIAELAEWDDLLDVFEVPAGPVEPGALSVNPLLHTGAEVLIRGLREFGWSGAVWSTLKKSSPAYERGKYS